ncbi:MAG: 3-dehydroquinate synthase [Rhodospirillales bacterium]|nr:3-dehydroquinate synthase [Rhodospirillales bacterium]MDE0378830.1 3-dehydroquinate synthase [Rhodospirillales bacterium]
MDTTNPDPRPGQARETVRVELGPRSYDVLVGSDLLREAGALLAPLLPGRSAIVVTDSVVANVYLDSTLDALKEAGFACSHVIVDAGEHSKDLATLGGVLDDILGRGIERTTTLVALGGGVVGDLTGFAASVLLRGVPFVQIPTTLLAQVDSGVGGKTGVNSTHGKNLIGTFYQPRLVLADVATLGTLPARELRAGYAEIVKYGLIDDPEFFAWLERNGAALLAGDRDLTRTAVAHSCRAKARIVAADERESGTRALLNLGHTFAHALEAETGYDGSLLHGEAVAYGIVLAHRLSAALGHCTGDDAARVTAHFRAIDLPSEAAALPAIRWDPPALIARMRRDKKVQDGRMTFVLTRGIGRAFLSQDVPPEALGGLLDQAFDQGARSASR